MKVKSVLSFFQRFFHLANHSSFTNEIKEYSTYKIGTGTYGRPQVFSWGDGTNLVIGKYCSIANGVRILVGGEHRMDWITTYPLNHFLEGIGEVEGLPRTKGDVIIGNDVWIGMGVIILSGVTIGNGAVIGAGSVVTKPIDSYAIAAGNPARLLRYRFSPDIVKKLNQLAWWDWPEEEIRAAARFLMSNDFDGLIAHRGIR